MFFFGTFVYRAWGKNPPSLPAMRDKNVKEKLHNPGNPEPQLGLLIKSEKQFKCDSEGFYIYLQLWGITFSSKRFKSTRA